MRDTFTFQPNLTSILCLWSVSLTSVLTLFFHTFSKHLYSTYCQVLFMALYIYIWTYLTSQHLCEGAVLLVSNFIGENARVQKLGDLCKFAQQVSSRVWTQSCWLRVLVFKPLCCPAPKCRKNADLTMLFPGSYRCEPCRAVVFIRLCYYPPSARRLARSGDPFGCHSDTSV